MNEIKGYIQEALEQAIEAEQDAITSGDSDGDQYGFVVLDNGPATLVIVTGEGQFRVNIEPISTDEYGLA